MAILSNGLDREVKIECAQVLSMDVTNSSGGWNEKMYDAAIKFYLSLVFPLSSFIFCFFFGKVGITSTVYCCHFFFEAIIFFYTDTRL